MALVSVQVQGTEQNGLVFTRKNFIALWFAMEINPITNGVCKGQVDGRLILSRLGVTPVEMIHQGLFGNQKPQVLRRNKVNFYVFSLGQLCKLAAQREDPVIWYQKEVIIG